MAHHQLSACSCCFCLTHLCSDHMMASGQPALHDVGGSSHPSFCVLTPLLSTAGLKVTSPRQVLPARQTHPRVRPFLLAELSALHHKQVLSPFSSRAADRGAHGLWGPLKHTGCRRQDKDILVPAGSRLSLLFPTGEDICKVGASVWKEICMCGQSQEMACT